VERKSGYLVAYKLERGNATLFAEAAKHGFTAVPYRYSKTLTLDNGTGMSNYEAIERQTGIQVYFAQPYHS
jgi:IS30 family transposase